MQVKDSSALVKTMNPDIDRYVLVRNCGMKNNSLLIMLLIYNIYKKTMFCTIDEQK